MNLIQNTILTSLPAGRKKTPSGWISFNAPCCVYNGETADKKKRGGIMTSADGTISYHCFNCGFKASYILGRRLNQKMRTFMSYIGVPDDTIKKLAIEAMRHEEGDDARQGPVGRRRGVHRRHGRRLLLRARERPGQEHVVAALL